MTPPASDTRFLSRDDCQALGARVFAMATGGGTTRLAISSRWVGNLRWARNDIATGGDTRDNYVDIRRDVRGTAGSGFTNSLADDVLRATVERAESLLLLQTEDPDEYPETRPPVHPHTHPRLWFDQTAQVTDVTRATLADRVIAPADAARVQSAGYVEVAAAGFAVVRSEEAIRYYPYTTVQCSITVRDVAGHGSGWAGVDWNDWARLDVDRLGQIALDKCLRSHDPVAVEPGRYTVILEPQAVCDLVAPIVNNALERQTAENGRGPFADPLRPGYSRIGQRVVDPSITLSADPMDPDCGFVPFDYEGEPFEAVRWIDRGTLVALAYDRPYGVHQLGRDAALPNPQAFRMSGGSATLDEMIAATTRGLLVTRLNAVQLVDFDSMLSTGTTRDGLWLIERGKISKAVKNFRFTESPMFVLNNVEQLGVPQRVFRPDAPAVVPPVMARDFSFTSLVDAV